MLGRVGAVRPRLAANDGGIAVRLVIDSKAEDAFEGHTPPVTAVEAEGVFLQVPIEMPGAEAMEGAHAPALHQREDAMDPEQDEMGSHFADHSLVEHVAFVCRPFIETEVGAMPVGQQRGARRDVLSNSKRQPMTVV